MSDATATGIYAQMNLAVGTVLAGRFRIEALLGLGGMGVVYRARDLALEVTVAVKLLRPELAMRPDSFERFRQELLLARQVSSAHVVRIHDLAQHENQWLISMDYVEGEGLDQRIGRGRLPLEDALRIARQIALGLQAAHERGVVHRDLKPANVLIDRAGNAFISDFGVARSLVSSGLTQTGVGAGMGTPDYLSPEQARGHPVDARSDLYALGLILHEMLTGMPAFQSATAAEAIAQRLVRSPPPITRVRPELPGWVARLTERLLRTQPAQRPGSASAVVAAIDRRAMPRDFRPRRPGWLAGGMVLLVLALAGPLWWMRHERQAPAAAVPALHRVVVMPLRGQGLPPDRLAALDAYLHARVFALSGVASVDAERTRQAQGQLDAAGNGPEPAAMRRLAAADRSLSVQLRRRGERWYVQARLDSDDGASQVLDGPAADQAAAAFKAWLVRPALDTALGAAPGGTMPVPVPDTPTLDAFGHALRTREQDHLADALGQVQAITARVHDDPVLWLTQLQLAQAVGERDVAFAATEQGQRAAKTAPSRLRRVFDAEYALQQGDVPAAIGQWRAQLAATPDDTWSDLQLARAQGSGGDYHAALDRLAALSARDGDDPRTWFELGKFSILQGDARRAVDDYLVHALVLYKRSRNTYGVAETVNALGIGYGRLGQTTDAEEQYRKAVALRRQIGNRRGVATSLRNLANVLSQRGKLDQAGDTLAQARALDVELDDREGLAAVDNELGVLAEERGDFTGALQAYQRALRGWQQTGNAHGVAQGLNDVGYAYYQLGRYDDAQSYWQRAAGSDAGLGETGRIRVRENLGLLATARGHWDEAGKLQRQVLADAEKAQMPEEAAVSRRNLAELALLRGNPGASLAQADRAIALFREREDSRGEADTRVLRVRALLAAGAVADARRELQALQAGPADGSREQRARVQLLQAAVALQAGQAHKAAEALDRAQPLAAGSGVRELQLRVDLMRARLQPQAGKGLDQATATLGNAELRLDWLALTMQRALAAEDAPAALRAYREAIRWMHGSDVLDAASLHALGARAYRLAGNAAAAVDAERAAAAAREHFQAAVPAALRAAGGAKAATGRHRS